MEDEESLPGCVAKQVKWTLATTGYRLECAFGPSKHLSNELGGADAGCNNLSDEVSEQHC